MAPSEPQSAKFVDSLICDILQQVIDQRQYVKSKVTEPSEPCQRLYDILGLISCSSDNDVGHVQSEPTKDSWLAPLQSHKDSSYEEGFQSGRTPEISHIACQTEQPRLKKLRMPREATSNGSAVPCELTRQTIYIGAATEAPPAQYNRPPIADRFCYMLTDFASAMYCSLAIMCCCSPSMLR